MKQVLDDDRNLRVLVVVSEPIMPCLQRQQQANLRSEVSCLRRENEQLAGMKEDIHGAYSEVDALKRQIGLYHLYYPCTDKSFGSYCALGVSELRRYACLAFVLKRVYRCSSFLSATSIRWGLAFSQMSSIC